VRFFSKRKVAELEARLAVKGYYMKKC